MLIPKLTSLLAIVIFVTGSTSEDIDGPCRIEFREVICENKDRWQLSLEQIARYLKEKGHTRFKKLGLRSMYLGMLELQVLNGIYFQKLEISNSQLDGITDTGVANVENLRAFNIRVSIGERNESFKLDLSSLQNVNDFRIYNSDIKRVPNDWFGFRNLATSLKHLSMSGNGIQYIDDKAFYHLVNLHCLVLKKNLLKYINRTMMPAPGAQLHYLDLSNNLLNFLPTDLFEGLTSLNRIDLRGNKIQYLSQDTWKSVWPNLRYLNVKGNLLDCSDEIEWIANYSVPDVLIGYCTTPFSRRRWELTTLINRLKYKGDPDHVHGMKKGIGRPQRIAFWLPLLKVVVPLLPWFRRG